MPDLTKRQPPHPSRLTPRFDARDVTPDPLSAALARYLETEREIFEAHMALIRDLSETFNTAPAMGRERD